MSAIRKGLIFLCGATAVLGAAAIGYILIVGLSARNEPTAIETFIARSVRGAAVARSARGLVNPVALSEQVVSEARAHYADHCAGCHANDGSGNTEMGRGLFPRAPDMRLAATQDMTDGELFWTIENGIRFTGMPGWSKGTAASADASWKLVHFIRRLPKLSSEDIRQMEDMNPRSPDEIRQEIEEQRFLEGGDPAPAAPAHDHGGGHD
ncbi:MAG: c-type cytochrome [Vicinamibacterales bacterium]|nr:c-type cytochrome [Vicinamibacterales bacterium]